MPTTDPTATYITGSAIVALVDDLENNHGLTLSNEARARLYGGVQRVLLPVVQHALDQDMATTRLPEPKEVG